MTPAIAGFQGSVVQRLRTIEPPWKAVLLATAAIAGVIHPLETLLHRWAGTPHLSRGILASVIFTLLATAFTLHVMRQGAFLSGERRSFREDLTRIPELILGFLRLSHLNNFIANCFIDN